MSVSTCGVSLHIVLFRHTKVALQNHTFVLTVVVISLSLLLFIINFIYIYIDQQVFFFPVCTTSIDLYRLRCTSQKWDHHQGKNKLNKKKKITLCHVTVQWSVVTKMNFCWRVLVEFVLIILLIVRSYDAIIRHHRYRSLFSSNSSLFTPKLHHSSRHRLQNLQSLIHLTTRKKVSFTYYFIFFLILKLILFSSFGIMFCNLRFNYFTEEFKTKLSSKPWMSSKLLRSCGSNIWYLPAFRPVASPKP